jgi:hypothetical protein
VGARNDPDGIAVINWWRERCIEWCHDYVDQDRFADQGYLDSFSRLFSRVRVIENVGANLAPWNIGNYRIDVRDRKVMIDADHPLIFFHFQGLAKGLRWFIFNSHRVYRAPFSGDVRRHIYKPYVDELLAIEKVVAPILQGPVAAPHRRSAITNLPQYLKSKLRTSVVRLFQFLDLVTGRACLVLRGKAY